MSNPIKQNIFLNVPRKIYKSKKPFYKKKKVYKKENTGKILLVSFDVESRHYKNKCRRKQKINELNLDEGLKKQWLQVLINSSISRGNMSNGPPNFDSEAPSEEPENDCSKNFKCINCTTKIQH